MTIVGNNETYHWEDLVGPFLVEPAPSTPEPNGWITNPSTRTWRMLSSRTHTRKYQPAYSLSLDGTPPPPPRPPPYPPSHAAGRTPHLTSAPPPPRHPSGTQSITSFLVQPPPQIPTPSSSRVATALQGLALAVGLYTARETELHKRLQAQEEQAAQTHADLQRKVGEMELQTAKATGLARVPRARERTEAPTALPAWRRASGPQPGAWEQADRGKRLLTAQCDRPSRPDAVIRRCVR